MIKCLQIELLLMENSGKANRLQLCSLIIIEFRSATTTAAGRPTAAARSAARTAARTATRSAAAAATAATRSSRYAGPFYSQNAYING